MKLYLVRHAQSVANALATSSDVNIADPDLTAKGYLQAEATAIFFNEHLYMPRLCDQTPQPFVPNAIYSSPTRRGLKTAKVIADKLGLDVGIDVYLHEVGGASGGCDIWGGMVRRDAHTVAGNAYFVRNYPVMGWWFREDETKEQVFSRIQDWLIWLKNKHAIDDVVIVVGHGALFDHLAAIAFGHPNQITWMSMHNASVARIDLCDTVWKLIFWNQTSHLAGLLSY